MIIVFDFDKTLTYRDTILDFFKFCCPKVSVFYSKLPLYIIAIILKKFNLMDNLKVKKIGVGLFLKGSDYNIIQERCKCFAKKIKLNKSVYDKFLQHKKDINDIYIISASFLDYLKYIFPNENIIASELMYKKDRLISITNDCYGELKKKRLIDKKIYEIDIFYTDSMSDIPLVKISKKVIFVNKDNLIECNSNREFIDNVKKARGLNLYDSFIYCYYIKFRKIFK